jgi:hypothetical protein
MVMHRVSYSKYVYKLVDHACMMSAEQRINAIL